MSRGSLHDDPPPFLAASSAASSHADVMHSSPSLLITSEGPLCNDPPPPRAPFATSPFALLDSPPAMLTWGPQLAAPVNQLGDPPSASRAYSSPIDVLRSPLSLPTGARLAPVDHFRSFPPHRVTRNGGCATSFLEGATAAAAAAAAIIAAAAAACAEAADAPSSAVGVVGAMPTLPKLPHRVARNVGCPTSFLEGATAAAASAIIAAAAACADAADAPSSAVGVVGATPKLPKLPQPSAPFTNGPLHP